MTPTRFMVIAGEASGDLLAAELVRGIRQSFGARQRYEPGRAGLSKPGIDPQFFGAGGPAMKSAGVDLAFDMTAHAVVGLIEVLRNYGKFRRLFRQLLELAIQRQPDAIICVDFSGFNRRFAHAVRQYAAGKQRMHSNWQPKIIQYISPQVWASREGRAHKMARDFDLLLSIFPFEKEWYAKRVPDFSVQFVGHPLVDRYAQLSSQAPESNSDVPLVVLLPGSRTGELARHLPVIRDAVKRLQSQIDIRWRMILPNDSLAQRAQLEFQGIAGGEIRTGGLAESLSAANLAIASTGTVTMECAWFGVPTVAIYKTSWSTYQIAKRIIKVRFLAMPNILADQTLFPELVQNEATGDNIARVALELLQDPARGAAIKARLKAVIGTLGQPGAATRAAEAIIDLLRV
jgi:lipid-A-disaccharide synthase